MTKFNLHLHTKYSDGNNSIREMAEWVRDEGFCCLVTSDHDYMMKPCSYERQLREAEQVSKEIGFPIICGLEISMWYEEAVLIGKDACLKWLNERENPANKADNGVYLENHTYKKMPSLLDGFNYGLCLVHPGLRQPGLDYGMFHCYEVMNSGSYWGDNAMFKFQELMPNAKPVAGMDAHSARWSKCLMSYTPVSAPLVTEAEIINWMRNPSLDRRKISDEEKRND